MRRTVTPVNGCHQHLFRPSESDTRRQLITCPVGICNYQQGHPRGVSQEDEVVTPIVILAPHLGESQGQNDCSLM